MNKVFKNASWIIGCKIVQSIINLIIGMISARYLGPSNYGLINYASSIVAFTLPVMQLGFTKTIIQEFMERPDNEGIILGTAYVFNIIASLFCMGCIFIFLSVANSGETETITVGVLYSVSLIFNATEIVQYWFQSKLLSKYSAIASLVAYFFVAIYKVYLLVKEKSVLWFAFTATIDYFLISIILIVIYYKVSSQKLGFSWNIGFKMLNRSKYYIISSMMTTIFAQTDKIMLKMMINAESTGFYSTATACVGITSFVFAAIIDSMRPVILEAKRSKNNDYERKIIILYAIITWLSLIQSIFITLLAKPIVLILYGEAYLPAVCPLRIVVWYTTFSYYGSVRNIWILAEEKQKYLWIINASGAGLNIVLNICLIRLWGVEGAAVASLITQFFTNVIIGFIIKDIRDNNTFMIKALNPIYLLDTIKNQFLTKINRS